MKFACRLLITGALLLLLSATPLRATQSYSYQPGEYVTINQGTSPDGRWAIATHGEGEMGDVNFHVYLMDAKTGKKIGPLTEIKEFLDTGAGAFNARWTADSSQVSIQWRRERHFGGMSITYRIADRRAYCIRGPVPVGHPPGE